MSTSLRASSSLLALALVSLSPALPLPDVTGRAEASVVRPQSFEQLVDRASLVVVAKPVERTSVWEDSRIVTYTRVDVLDRIAGEGPSVLWIRTLGGEVGEFGQHVDGEATLELAKVSVLFLEPASAGTFAVSARAQGQFLVEERPSGRVLRPHPAMGVFLTRGPKDIVIPAAERLKTRAVEDVARDVRARWEKTHARR